MPSSNDIHPEFQGSMFALELDGVQVGFFTGCSGLGAEVAVTEVKVVDDKGRQRTKKVPGHLSFNDIVLKRGYSADKALTDWFHQIVEGKVKDARRSGSVVVYDHAGAEVDRWNFEAGWPSKWSASDLDASTDDVMIEELTIVHEWLERKS
ncbi:MAG: phage tail protein [Acidimicrobiia bacterium]|jgi:phage tail-like protein